MRREVCSFSRSDAMTALAPALAERLGLTPRGLPRTRRLHATFDAADIVVVGLRTVLGHHEAMSALLLRDTPSLALIDCRGRVRCIAFDTEDEMQVDAAAAAPLCEVRARPTAPAFDVVRPAGVSPG